MAYEFLKGFENTLMGGNHNPPICRRTDKTCSAAQSSGHSVDEIRFNVVSCALCPVDICYREHPETTVPIFVIP